MVGELQDGDNTNKYALRSYTWLKLAYLKLESLVIADQRAAVNTFSNFALTKTAIGSIYC